MNNDRERIFEIINKIDNKIINKDYFIDNIENLTIKNDNYRYVLFTSKHLQLVLMSIKPNSEIGLETHNNDQFFRIESGNGKCIINDNEFVISDGMGIIVPANNKHNIINTGDTNLNLYTIYSPPHHKDGLIMKNND